MRRPTVPLVLSAALLLGGCGTTVPGSALKGGNLTSESGLGTGAQAPSGTVDTSGGTGPAALGGAAPVAGGSAGPGVRPSAPAQTTTPTGPPVSQKGKLPGRHRGVSPTTIKVGFLYLANAGTTVSTFGVQGYSQGDELGEFKALVADQNAKGGVAGRRLEIVPRDLGGIDESNYQAACTFFTQDSPVFMVFSADRHVGTLNTCLAKASVGYTSDYIAPPDRLMRELGPIYAPDDISAERYSALLGSALIDAGFFGKGAKVGIIRMDTPDYARITKQVLRPILARAGVEIVAEESYNSTDASATIGDAGPLAFRLRSKGVTHVVSYESPLFYMTAAESQQWRPWWAVTSRAGPGAFLEGAAPKEQLKKTMGPGWQPVSDLASSRLTSLNSEEARCMATMKKAGYNLSYTPRYVATMLCGELYHFVRALGIATEVSTAGFRAAAEALAPYPSPMTFAMSFAGGRHDGAAAYRIVAWREACGCYGYTSPLRPIPTS